MEREEWNRRYEGAELLWTATPNQMLVGEVEHLPAGRALDVACGEGRNAVWLAEKGWSVTGVDFSDVALGKARRLAQARGVSVDWVLADLRSYHPRPGAYDLVVVLYLHLPADERRTVHLACTSSLRPGGVLIVLGHDVSNLTDGYGGPQDVSILFTPDDVVADLAGTGVTIERAERVQRRVSTETGERIAIDALVRAARS